MRRTLKKAGGKLFVLLAAALLFVAGPAPAQDEETAASTAAPEEGGKKPVEEIVVTGSLIKRKDLTTPAPVAQIGRLELETAGFTSLGQILQNLPAQSNAINIQVNNGGDGSTRINLRGIGEHRTLVLLNGRRVVYGGVGADSSVDLNTIPAAIIDRVEVLKDGASTVYGSDAIGGVVNLITRKDFDGVEADAYLGTSQRGDGSIYDIAVTMGKKYEKGNILFSAGVFEIFPIWCGDRDFSKFDYQMDDWETLTTYKGGSSSPPEGNIIHRRDGASPEFSELQGRYGYWGWYTNDPIAGWSPVRFNGTSDSGSGTLYNYQPSNYLVTPQERYNVFSSGNWSFHDLVRGFFEGMYTKRYSDQKLAPEPIFSLSEEISVSADNYYNPFHRNFIDVRRRMVEGGLRHFIQDLDTFRIATGFEGSLPEGLGPLSSWTWELSYNYGRTSATNTNTGNYDRARLAKALGPSFRDADGKIVCGTPDNPDYSCVPLNIFGGPGTITQEMLDYIGYTGTARGYNQQEVVKLALTGDLVEIPFGGMMGVALGYEYREEFGGYMPNPLEAKGDTTGNKSEPVEGGYYVGEFYTELNIPLLADMPAVDLFEVNGSFRFSDYNTFGSKVTWKVGGRWQVLPDVALRGTYSTAFRAPTIGQLYSGNYDDFPLASDPCDTSEGLPNDTVRANCAAEGVPSDLYAPEDQLKARAGGNPALKPETADIITAGMVFTPSFLEGLSVTVDFWKLMIRNAIQRIGADVILSLCYNREPGTESEYCKLVVRDPQTHSIDHIVDIVQNIGGTDTWGIDAAIRYDWKSDFGRWLFSLEGTYTGQYEDIQADGTRVNGQGVYDLSLVLPDWRFNFGTMWSWDEYGAGFNLRFVGPFKECEDNDCTDRTNAAGEPVPAFSRTVDPYVLVDLYFTYTLEWDLGTTRLTLGVNNVFDTNPAVIYNGFTATSDPTAYDFLGRYFFGRLTQTF